MRLGAVRVLTTMLLRFFLRRVLHVGLLRIRAFRVVAAVLVVILLVTISSSGYFFLRPIATNERVWDALFEATTASVVMWVLIAFLLVKTLFINADGMLAFTFQLPATNRERFAALMAYELIMVSSVAFFALITLASASILLMGPAAVPHLFEVIFVPLVLTYLAAAVTYALLVRLFGALGLRRTRTVLANLVMFAVTIGYISQLGSITTQMTRSNLRQTDDFIWVGTMTWISTHHGYPVMLLVFVAASVCLLAALIVASPTEHVSTSSFVPVPVPRGLRPCLTPYDWCAIRSNQALLATLVAAIFFVGLLVRPPINPLWATSLSALGGLYAYAQTEPLRANVSGRIRARQVYWSLLCGQLLIAAPIDFVAVVLLTPAHPDLVPGLLPPLCGHVAAILLSIGIGVAFPAEHDNPFSVFVGLRLAVVILLVFVVSVGLLQLPPPALVCLAITAAAAVAIYTVQGIAVADSVRRGESPGVLNLSFTSTSRDRGNDYETFDHNLECGAWGTADDADNLRGRPALPHVHQQRR